MGDDHVHTAENIRDGVENSLRLHEHRPPRPRAVPPQPHARTSSRSRARCRKRMKLRDEGKVRFIGVSGTLPNLDEQIDMGVFDAFQIPYSRAAARPRGRHRPGVGGRRRHHHPRRRRPRRARRTGSGRRYYMVAANDHAEPLGRGQARRAARRHDAHRVHAALHALEPRPRHDDRRHQEPRPPARQRRHGRQGPAARRRRQEAKRRLAAMAAYRFAGPPARPPFLQRRAARASSSAAARAMSDRWRRCTCPVGPVRGMASTM